MLSQPYSINYSKRNTKMLYVYWYCLICNNPNVSIAYLGNDRSLQQHITTISKHIMCRVCASYGVTNNWIETKGVEPHKDYQLLMARVTHT